MIGASQAFFNPAAYTLLSEIFPKKIIGSINGIFSSGVYLGGGLASLSIILDSSIGWRNTLFFIGGLGVVISGMCYFLVAEPRAVTRKENEMNSMMISAAAGDVITQPAAAPEAAAQSVTDVVSGAITSLKEVLESNEARLLFFASVLRFCAGFSIAIWKAPFVFAKFPDNASSFAGKNILLLSSFFFLPSSLPLLFLTSRVGFFLCEELYFIVNRSHNNTQHVKVPVYLPQFST